MGSERVLVGRQRTSVDVQPLLHHSDVPNAHTAVSVAGDNSVAPQIERGAVARVAVTVQRLNTKPRARIPK